MVIGTAAALHSVAASIAEGPTIEAASAGAGYVWKPSTATVGPGGTVSFKNTSAVVPHGVTWTGGPETPSCTGVPVNQEKTNWSGDCTFAQAGSYAFVCTVHPNEMKGTITVSSGGTKNPPPPSTGGPESPLAGPASRALKIAKDQRGGSVRGSIDLAQAGAGGKLEVDLLARRASLFGAGKSGTARVGRLMRSNLRAGRVPFVVVIKRLARRALRSHERLALTVRVILDPPGQKAVKMARRVVLHV
jgi:plastocyanin